MNKTVSLKSMVGGGYYKFWNFKGVSWYDYERKMGISKRVYKI